MDEKVDGILKEKLEIIIEDPKARMLMTRMLGQQQMISELTYQIGFDKGALRDCLSKLYPNMDFGSGWIWDLNRKVIKKVYVK